MRCASNAACCCVVRLSARRGSLRSVFWQNECRAAVVGLCDFFTAKLRREPFLQTGGAADASAESTLHAWCVNHRTSRACAAGLTPLRTAGCVTRTKSFWTACARSCVARTCKVRWLRFRAACSRRSPAFAGAVRVSALDALMQVSCSADASSRRFLSQRGCSAFAPSSRGRSQTRSTVVC